MKLRFFSFVACTVALFGLTPLMGQAATLQQKLDKAFLLDAFRSKPTAATVQVHIQFDETPFDKKADKENFSADLLMDVRDLPPAEGSLRRNSEGRVRVLNVKGVLDGQSFEAKDAATFEWKMVDGNLYFRLASLADQWQTLLREESEMDPALFVGVWIHIPETDLKAFSSGGLSGLSSDVPLESISALQTSKGLSSIFRILNVERRWKSSEGASLVRARVGLSPAVYTWIRKEALKGLRPGTAEYRSALTSLNKSLVEMQKFIGKARFIVVLDETSGVLQRFEMGYSDRQPMKDSTYVGNKFVFKTIGYSMLRVAFGVQLSRASLDAILPPETSLTIEQFQKLLLPEDEDGDKFPLVQL